MADPRCKLRAVRFRSGGSIRVVTGPEDPAPNVVGMLETALEQARSGELQGIALAKVMANGNTRTGWEFSNRLQSDGHRLMSAVAILFHEYAKAMTDTINV